MFICWPKIGYIFGVSLVKIRFWFARRCKVCKKLYLNVQNKCSDYFFLDVCIIVTQMIFIYTCCLHNTRNIHLNHLNNFDTITLFTDKNMTVAISLFINRVSAVDESKEVSFKKLIQIINYCVYRRNC